MLSIFVQIMQEYRQFPTMCSCVCQNYDETAILKRTIFFVLDSIKRKREEEKSRSKKKRRSK